MRKTTILTITLLLALPAAMVVAGPAVKAYLSRPADAAEDATECCKIKIKNDRKGGLQLFSVQVKDAAAGTYGVWLVDTAEVPAADVELGSITIADGEDGGKLKFNTKRGDELATDPVGWMVEVRNGAGDVILSGLVPDPDAPKVKGNVKAKLVHPGEGDAKGFVRLKLGNGAQHLQVVAQKADSATYDVMIETAEDVWEKAGELVVADGESSGSWMAKDKAGDAVPGATSFAGLQGLDIRVQTQDTEPVVLLEGTIPEIVGKKGPKK